MPSSPARSVYVLRGVLGDLTRRYGPTDPRTIDVRRELRRAQVERAVTTFLTGDPAPTADDRAAVVALLSAPAERQAVVA